VNSSRKSAVVAGVFFIVAAVAAIIGLALEGPVLNDSHYIVAGSGADARVCLLYTSPSPRDLSTSRMPSSA